MNCFSILPYTNAFNSVTYFYNNILADSTKALEEGAQLSFKALTKDLTSMAYYYYE